MTQEIVHEFKDCLRYSELDSDEPTWDAFYRSVWPDMISAARIQANCEWQRQGVDRVLFLSGGRHVFVDEKKRKKDYGDILLEVWDQVPRDQFDTERKRLKVRPKKRGWAWDDKKRTDFVVYAIPSAGKAYLLPFELLRLTMVRELDGWKKDRSMYPKVASNRDYLTINVAVSWEKLSAAMGATMLRLYGKFP